MKGGCVMNQLKALIWYECIQALKMVLIFYSVFWGSFALMSLMVVLRLGEGVNIFAVGTEMWAMILATVTGAVLFIEDYRQLQQNGFTRRAIFSGEMFCFLFMAALVASFETVIPRFVGKFLPQVHSVVARAFGSNVSWLGNWLLLLGTFFFIASMTYLITVIIVRLGKRRALIVGIVFWCGIMIVLPALMAAFDSVRRLVGQVFEMICVCLGFGDAGVMHIWPPIFTAMAASVLVVVCGYLVMRRFEWRW